jgi:microcystin-dependent protein
MDPILGQIIMFAGNFAPRGWAFCNGQLLSIAQNTALFSILGTTYGGDGVSTFGLPNLQGRMPMHWGNGTGLTPRTIGVMAGVESVTLVASQMPIHNHLMAANSGNGDQLSPGGNVPAIANTGGRAPTQNPSYTTASNATMASTAISAAGGNQPHDNMPPFQCLSFIIATEGVYPTRD